MSIIFGEFGGINLLHPSQDSATIAGMERDHAIATLQAHEPQLRQLGVQRLYLFGSTARGDARGTSDVDLFFDYEDGKFGLFDLMDAQEYTSRVLGAAADVMTRDSIHEVLRPRIEATALRVF
jgi:predicted nucleotidyltransferase